MRKADLASGVGKDAGYARKIPSNWMRKSVGFEEPSNDGRFEIGRGDGLKVAADVRVMLRVNRQMLVKSLRKKL